MELTDEQIEFGIERGFLDFTTNSRTDDVRILALALQAEKAKPKDDVWRDAPEWATHTYRTWTNKQKRVSISETIVRELPKTIEQEFTEKLQEYLLIDDPIEPSNIFFTRMLKEYAARLQGKE